MKNILAKKKTVLFFALLVLVLFAYITYKTPLAGDDWGYALNGMKGNPISQAFLFYQTWSGRFFSELWGFVVAPNKWLWNILNPLIFASVFVYVYILSNKKEENSLAVSLLIFTMMININGDLRMETYSWIMGTTYVVPLALSLLYFVIIFKYYSYLKGMPLWVKIITCLICFYIGLTMENIAAIMVFAELLLIINYYIENRKKSTILLVNMIISLISFIIMRISPGSAFRLMRDHAVFNSMSILDKIIYNMPSFIGYSFVEHKMTIGIFATSLIGLLFFKEKNKIIKWLLVTYQFVSIFMLFSSNIGLVLHNNFIINLNDKNSIIVWIYWIIYVVIAFLILIRNVTDKKHRLAILFFITIGGSCNLVMLMSPIFGARSSLYFIYFLIVATVLIYKEFIRKGNIWIILIMVVFAILSGLRVREYYKKYTLVGQINKERESIIEYYKVHPEEDIYIPRMPIYSIHAGDIEDDDVYHFDTFKAYYGLNPNAKVIFYWKDSY